MFCPICKSFIVSVQSKCHACGKILRKKRNKNNAGITVNSKDSKNNQKSKKNKNSAKNKNNKNKAKAKSNKNKKNKNKAKAKSNKNKKNKKNKNKNNKKNYNKVQINGGYLGGKTRHYNDRRRAEYEVLGCCW